MITHVPDSFFLLGVCHFDVSISRRLAMIAIGGMVHGALVTGQGFPYLP
jgi:hypothetical protein